MDGGVNDPLERALRPIAYDVAIEIGANDVARAKAAADGAGVWGEEHKAVVGRVGAYVAIALDEALVEKELTGEDHLLLEIG
jgi:hypothetical protein